MSTEIISEKFANKYANKQPNWGFNGLGYIVYKRTYARLKEDGKTEEWHETIRRCINGAQKIGANYSQEEAEQLFHLIFNLKCNFAGRMLWQLGTPTIDRFGANSLLNCWNVSMNSVRSFLFLFENLMLGGGVGFSIRREDIHELPRIKKGVNITHKNTKDADFIVPDSREGWIHLLEKVLEAFFVNGKSFNYSTILIRGAGERISGFGGIASGPQILLDGIEKINKIFQTREGKKLRSVDVLDVCNIIGGIVVSGNVRRSAQIAIGDPDDYLFLRAKNWSLGNIPNWRAMSNNTIYADDFSHISNEIWSNGYALDSETGFAKGEPYGFFNLPLSQKYGRLKDGPMKDSNLYPTDEDNVVGTNPCIVGDTLIAVADGRNAVTIEELTKIGKSVPVYSVNPLTGKTEIKIARNPRVTGKNKEIWKVTLDDGSFFKATSNHKILLKSLKYVELKNLKRNDSIFPFNTFNNNNYRQICNTGEKMTGGARRNRRQYRLIHEFFNEKVNPKIYAIHHKDFNSLNDSPDNLEVLSHEEHIKLHSQKMMGKNNPYHRMTDEWKFNFASHPFEKNPKYSGFTNNELIRIGKEILQKEGKFTHGLWIKYAKNNGYPQYLGNSFRFGSFKKFKDIVIGNHKVKSIEFCGYEDVYNITVDNNHNYCIITSHKDSKYIDSSGVCIKNCGEISLASYECCNLSELYLNNITSKEELIICAKLLYKTQKAIAALPFIHEETNKIVHKNMRLGLGVTGVCQSLNKIDWLDTAYKELRKFDKEWSKERGWNRSIKLTTVKPSGTLSLLAGSTPGVHPAYSKYYIRRIRMASNDPLVNYCRDLGYNTEYVINFDGSENHDTIIVEFPCETPDGAMFADDMGVTKQLEMVKKLQEVWSDNAVSVTAYYSDTELSDLKKWLSENYENGIKSVSFLLRQKHGFKQAPYEEITKEAYESKKSKVKPIAVLNQNIGSDALEGIECEGGACPIK